MRHSGWKRRLSVGVTLLGILGAYLVLDSRLVTGEDAYFHIENGVDDMVGAYNLLYTDYVKELKPEDLSKSAIEGMLQDLDPYTSFFDGKALEQLQIDTRGNFGGLGITITKRRTDDNPPVVMSVIEGTPADTSGLLVGDRIVMIEGDSTHAKELSAVVDVLRGRPGDPVTITIERPGLAKWFNKSIIRARIGIPSVIVPGEIDPEIAYISMSDLNSGRFTERTSGELQVALEAELAKNPKGLILDLRGNPGGLLSSAVDVVDKFLDPGQVVVTTKGRRAEQTRSEETRTPMVVPRDIPLVVLVNGHSASASEIVAGAIQDWDRGLILGTQTFGKGSVQTVRQLGNDQALKLTTAAYYTPSGRSIHNTTRRNFRGGPIELTLADSMRVSAYELLSIIAGTERREEVITELGERFEMNAAQAEEVLSIRMDRLLGLGVGKNSSGPVKTDPEEVFRTRIKKRKVYGGGGIKPDVVVDVDRRPRVWGELYQKSLFFDFAVHFAANRTFPARYEDYRMPEDLIDQFWFYVADSTHANGFDYKAGTEIQLRDLKKTLEEKGVLSKEDELAMEQLSHIATKERQADYKEAGPSILLEIERILARRVWGTKAEMLVSLKGDKQFQEAVRILKDHGAYEKKLAMIEE
ncbi:MAG: S41 family peptidase [bacterium]|nr:S41 family peptidase [bacterium]